MSLFNCVRGCPNYRGGAGQIHDYGLSSDEAEVLTERRDVALLMDELVKEGASIKVASNWIRTEILRC